MWLTEFFDSVFILYGSGSRSTILGWIPIRTRIHPNPGFWWPKIEKKLLLKKKTFFWIKNYNTIYLSLGLHKGFLSRRRSLQTSKENIQHFKTWNFLIYSTFESHFCPRWSGSGFQIRIRINWPDWIGIQYGFGSETKDLQMFNKNVKPVVRQCGGRWARCRCWRRALTWVSAWSPARAPGTAPSCPRRRGRPSPSPGRTDLRVKAVLWRTKEPQMSSLLVFNRVYRLEIQSVILIYLRSLLWTVAPLPSLWPLWGTDPWGKAVLSWTKEP